MKKNYLILGVLTCTFLVTLMYSCKKNSSTQDLESLAGKGKGALTLTVVPENDTVHFREADSVFNVAVAHGLRTAFEGKYPYVIPHLKLSYLFFLNDAQVALHVPVGLDPVTGKRLTMIVFKEHGRKRVVFTEHEPTAASRKTNANYNELTGTIRFYDYSGTAKRAFQMAGGAPIAEIPVGGGGTSSVLGTPSKTAPNAKPASAFDGPWDPDGDEDDDGVINELDKCWRTPYAVMVDSDGCPYEYDLNLFEVFAKLGSDGFLGVWPIFQVNPGIPPTPDYTSYFPPDEPLSAGAQGSEPPDLPGIMCGSVATIATGVAQTGQVNNLGGKYVHLATGTPFTVNFGQACIEVNVGNANKASNIIIDAFNFATNFVLMQLNAGKLAPNAVILKEAVREEIVANLNAIAPGSSFSEGPCIGANKPITTAKYYNPNTGNCE